MRHLVLIMSIAFMSLSACTKPVPILEPVMRGVAKVAYIPIDIALQSVGGSTPYQRGVDSQKTQIQTLSRQKDQLESQLGYERRRQNNLYASLKQKEYELGGLRGSLSSSNNQAKILKNEIYNLKSQINTSNQQAYSLQNSLASKENDLSQSLIQQANLREVVQQQDRELQSYQSSIDSSTARIAQLQNKINTTSSSSSSQNDAIRQLSAERDLLRRTINHVNRIPGGCVQVVQDSRSYQVRRKASCQ